MGENSQINKSKNKGYIERSKYFKDIKVYDISAGYEFSIVL